VSAAKNLRQRVIFYGSVL